MRLQIMCIVTLLKVYLKVKKPPNWTLNPLWNITLHLVQPLFTVTVYLWQYSQHILSIEVLKLNYIWRSEWIEWMHVCVYCSVRSRTRFVFLTISTCLLVCSSLSSLSFSVIIRQELVLATLPKEQFTVCREVLMMRVGSATHHQHWAAQCEEQVSVYCWPEIALHTYLETKRKIIFTEQLWRKIFDKVECLQRDASKSASHLVKLKCSLYFTW